MRIFSTEESEGYGTSSGLLTSSFHFLKIAEALRELANYVNMTWRNVKQWREHSYRSPALPHEHFGRAESSAEFQKHLKVSLKDML